MTLRRSEYTHPTEIDPREIDGGGHEQVNRSQVSFQVDEHRTLGAGRHLHGERIPSALAGYWEVGHL